MSVIESLFNITTFAVRLKRVALLDFEAAELACWWGIGIQ